MLQIFPLSTENIGFYNTIDRRYLSGELAKVKISRSGFALSYISINEAKWRQEQPVHNLPAEEILKQRDMVCYLAFANKQCVGQMIVVENWNQRGIIWDIAVDLQHRREGIGTELLSAGEDWAKARKLFGLMAEVSDANPIACQFLEQKGFALGGVDQLLYHSLPAEGKKAPQFRDTALFFYYDFDHNYSL